METKQTQDMAELLRKPMGENPLVLIVEGESRKKVIEKAITALKEDTGYSTTGWCCDQNTMSDLHDYFEKGPQGKFRIAYIEQTCFCVDHTSPEMSLLRKLILFSNIRLLSGLHDEKDFLGLYVDSIIDYYNEHPLVDFLPGSGICVVDKVKDERKKLPKIDTEFFAQFFKDKTNHLGRRLFSLPYSLDLTSEEGHLSLESFMGKNTKEFIKGHEREYFDDVCAIFSPMSDADAKISMTKLTEKVNKEILGF